MEVNLNEKLLMVGLFVRAAYFVILVSVIAITSKCFFVLLKMSSKSSIFLFREHAFI